MSAIEASVIGLPRARGWADGSPWVPQLGVEIQAGNGIK
jgi:hypothetical protein